MNTQPRDGRVAVTMPGTGLVIHYASQRERDQSARLARARQHQADATGYIPSWEELSDDDRETAILEARNWLRAAAAAGLLGEPEPGTRTQWAVRYKGRMGSPSDSHIQPYDDQDMARRAASGAAASYPPEEPKVMYCLISPWKEAPDA